MSAADLHKRYVGRNANLVIGELTIPVLIIDARTVWNRTDVRVTPLGGFGTQWFAADRIKNLSTVEEGS